MSTSQVTPAALAALAASAALGASVVIADEEDRISIDSDDKRSTNTRKNYLAPIDMIRADVDAIERYIRDYSKSIAHCSDDVSKIEVRLGDYAERIHSMRAELHALLSENNANFHTDCDSDFDSDSNADSDSDSDSDSDCSSDIEDTNAADESINPNQIRQLVDELEGGKEECTSVEPIVASSLEIAKTTKDILAVNERLRIYYETLCSARPDIHAIVKEHEDGTKPWPAFTQMSPNGIRESVNNAVNGAHEYYTAMVNNAPQSTSNATSSSSIDVAELAKKHGFALDDFKLITELIELIKKIHRFEKMSSRADNMKIRERASEFMAQFALFPDDTATREIPELLYNKLSAMTIANARTRFKTFDENVKADEEKVIRRMNKYIAQVQNDDNGIVFTDTWSTVVSDNVTMLHNRLMNIRTNLIEYVKCHEDIRALEELKKTSGQTAQASTRKRKLTKVNQEENDMLIKDLESKKRGLLAYLKTRIYYAYPRQWVVCATLMHKQIRTTVKSTSDAIASISHGDEWCKSIEKMIETDPDNVVAAMVSGLANGANDKLVNSIKEAVRNGANVTSTTDVAAIRNIMCSTSMIIDLVQKIDAQAIGENPDKKCKKTIAAIYSNLLTRTTPIQNAQNAQEEFVLDDTVSNVFSLIVKHIIKTSVKNETELDDPLIDMLFPVNLRPYWAKSKDIDSDVDQLWSAFVRPVLMTVPRGEDIGAIGPIKLALVGSFINFIVADITTPIFTDVVAKYYMYANATNDTSTNGVVKRGDDAFTDAQICNYEFKYIAASIKNNPNYKNSVKKYIIEKSTITRHMIAKIRNMYIDCPVPKENLDDYKMYKFIGMNAIDALVTGDCDNVDESALTARVRKSNTEPTPVSDDSGDDSSSDSDDELEDDIRSTKSDPDFDGENSDDGCDERDCMYAVDVEALQSDIDNLNTNVNYNEEYRTLREKQEPVQCIITDLLPDPHP